MGKNAQRRRAAPATNPAPVSSSNPPPSASFSNAEMVAMTSARDRAQAGTPAIIRSAFLGQPVKVGQVEIPVIMIGHVLLLQEIKSPLAQEGAGSPNNEQVIEALYALNHPPSAVLAKYHEGAAAWRAAIFDYAGTIPLRDIPTIGAALSAQLAAASSTMIGATTGENNSPASSGEAAGANGAKKNTAAPASPPERPLTASPTG